MLFVALGLHAALAVLAPALAGRWGRKVFLACAAAPMVTVALAASRARAVLAGDPVVDRFSWVPSLGVRIDLVLDAFSVLFVALVSGIGVLVFVYAFGYFSKPRADLGKFAGALTGFAGAMLGLVLADNLLALFVFWELTSITSYLLIGFEDRKPEARASALQALLVTGAGGLALFGGLVMLAEAAGTYSMSTLLAAPPSGPLVEAGLVLVLLGAFTKSAQAPFHTWLPGAMAAPTPVSAYLHSATMVKAGVYLVARLSPAFATAGVWRPLVITVGVTTMLVGAYRALRQTDLKLLLAFGTVSQLGFLIALFGAGTPKATFAGTALLLAHGVFKAALFMVVGIVDHQAHCRDLRRLTGLYAVMPAVFVVAVVTAASMAGLPPLLGFIAKEAAFEAFVQRGFGPLGTPALAGVVAGSMLTFAYSARFVWGAFARKETAPGREPVGPGVRPPTGVFVAPAVALAALTVLLGVVPAPVDPLVNEAAVALDPGWTPEHLALWHGPTVALWLSVVVVGIGLALFVARRGVERLQGLVPPLLGSSKTAYERSVSGLLSLAKRMTGVVQSGSLPIYLSVIAAVVVAVPASALLRVPGLPPAPPLAASVEQAVVAGIVVAAAAAAVSARRRFTAVLFLGAVGYAVAVLFVLYGAPDLALTQILFETLALVIFVLVLRHLPARFTAPRRPALPLYGAVRGAVAVAVGVFVFAFALIAAAARTAPPVSGEYVARALVEAEGRNVVNVILVDFRALDTLGEITVLTVAALGIVSLVLVSRSQVRTVARSQPPAEVTGVDGEGAQP